MIENEVELPRPQRSRFRHLCWSWLVLGALLCWGCTEERAEPVKAPPVLRPPLPEDVASAPVDDPMPVDYPSTPEHFVDGPTLGSSRAELRRVHAILSDDGAPLLALKGPERAVSAQLTQASLSSSEVFQALFGQRTINTLNPLLELVLEDGLAGRDDTRAVLATLGATPPPALKRAGAGWGVDVARVSSPAADPTAHLEALRARLQAKRFERLADPWAGCPGCEVWTADARRWVLLEAREDDVLLFTITADCVVEWRDHSALAELEAMHRAARRAPALRVTPALVDWLNAPLGLWLRLGPLSPWLLDRQQRAQLFSLMDVIPSQAPRFVLELGADLDRLDAATTAPQPWLEDLAFISHRDETGRLTRQLVASLTEAGLEALNLDEGCEVITLESLSLDRPVLDVSLCRPWLGSATEDMVSAQEALDVSGVLLSIVPLWAQPQRLWWGWIASRIGVSGVHLESARVIVERWPDRKKPETLRAIVALQPRGRLAAYILELRLFLWRWFSENAGASLQTRWVTRGESSTLLLGINRSVEAASEDTFETRPGARFTINRAWFLTHIDGEPRAERPGDHLTIERRGARLILPLDGEAMPAPPLNLLEGFRPLRKKKPMTIAEDCKNDLEQGHRQAMALAKATNAKTGRVERWRRGRALQSFSDRRRLSATAEKALIHNENGLLDCVASHPPWQSRAKHINDRWRIVRGLVRFEEGATSEAREELAAVCDGGDRVACWIFSRLPDATVPFLNRPNLLFGGWNHRMTGAEVRVVGGPVDALLIDDEDVCPLLPPWGCLSDATLRAREQAWRRRDVLLSLPAGTRWETARDVLRALSSSGSAGIHAVARDASSRPIHVHVPLEGVAVRSPAAFAPTPLTCSIGERLDAIGGEDNAVKPRTVIDVKPLQIFPAQRDCALALQLSGERVAVRAPSMDAIAFRWPEDRHALQTWANETRSGETLLKNCRTALSVDDDVAWEQVLSVVDWLSYARPDAQPDVDEQVLPAKMRTQARGELRLSEALAVPLFSSLSLRIN